MVMNDIIFYNNQLNTDKHVDYNTAKVDVKPIHPSKLIKYKHDNICSSRISTFENLNYDDNEIFTENVCKSLNKKGYDIPTSSESGIWRRVIAEGKKWRI
ncbi:hypothetical protein A3Q56_01758 [Intoshia linei]|uniref:Uncharacterized protein n=1 Tax=Intoshia linei TaxID=1819745 RepID=A0A177B845_9BILA|nr:hypothetical protein A3Q56_01758 [Intoshia linei]